MFSLFQYLKKESVIFLSIQKHDQILSISWVLMHMLDTFQDVEVVL